MREPPPGGGDAERGSGRSPAGRGGPGRAGAGRTPGRGSGAQRGLLLAAAARSRPCRPPAGLAGEQVLERRTGAGRGGEKGGPGSPDSLSLSTSGRSEPSNLPSGNGGGGSARGSGCSPPQVPPPSQPLQLAHPPSPRRRRRPFRAGRVPFPVRSDPGGAHAASAPPTVLTRRGHFLLVLVLVFAHTRRIRPHRHCADPAGRPAGPAGAEEEGPRRPPGGSAARRLLKAPRFSPPSNVVLICVGAQAVELGAGGGRTGFRAALFLSGVTFKRGGVGILRLPFGSDLATEFSFIRGISESSAVFSPSPKVIHLGLQRAVGDPDN